MDDRKAISVSEELHHLMLTIEGLRQLAERLLESSFDVGPLPSSIVSGLFLVRERIKLIDRAVRGSVDPWLLWSRENEALEPIDDGTDDDDIVLESWTDKRKVRRLRKELKSAKRRLRRAKGR